MLFTITSFLHHFAKAICFHLQCLLLNAEALLPYATLKEILHTQLKSRENYTLIKIFYLSNILFAFQNYHWKAPTVLASTELSVRSQVSVIK